MRKKRIMIVGPTQCGKTTLARRLEDSDAPIRRTPEPVYGKKTIDCPGAYVENTGLYCHLIAMAQDASHILLLLDQSRPVQAYSPKFAFSFTKPVFGVITKTDLCPENEPLCRKQLEAAGAETIIAVSTLSCQGIDKLKKILFNTDPKEDNV